MWGHGGGGEPRRRAKTRHMRAAVALALGSDAAAQGRTGVGTRAYRGACSARLACCGACAREREARLKEWLTTALQRAGARDASAARRSPAPAMHGPGERRSPPACGDAPAARECGGETRRRRSPARVWHGSARHGGFAPAPRSWWRRCPLRGRAVSR